MNSETLKEYLLDNGWTLKNPRSKALNLSLESGDTSLNAHMRVTKHAAGEYLKMTASLSSKAASKLACFIEGVKPEPCAFIAYPEGETALYLSDESAVQAVFSGLEDWGRSVDFQTLFEHFHRLDSSAKGNAIFFHLVACVMTDDRSLLEKYHKAMLAGDRMSFVPMIKEATIARAISLMDEKITIPMNELRRDNGL